MKNNTSQPPISAISGVRVGHWSEKRAKTGCSVVLFDRSCTASCHVSGGAPGSHETDLLNPSCLINGVDAILLSGGSSYGLAAATGIKDYLEKHERGFKAGSHFVPVVPGAVIFDLANGDGRVRPGAREGYLACLDSENQEDLCGAVGAGCGATIGKYIGYEYNSPGGIGSVSSVVDNGVAIGALMVSNCYGCIIDPATGAIVAGPKNEEGSHLPFLDIQSTPPEFGSTAIGVVVTDAALTKAQAQRLAIMAHDGIARTVSPSHTPYDGDIIFVVSLGERSMEISRLGAWGAEMVQRAMLASVGL